MDARTEIREFLTSRRARITPGQAGLPHHSNRRVPGLRREEVAVLAGVSVPYYTRIERGDLSGASASVLDALARALQLDDAERAHLLDLARAAQPSPPARRQRRTRAHVRPDLQWTLDAMTGVAASIRNRRLDILATNQLGRALHAPHFERPDRPVNIARFVFLDPRAADYYRDWERSARECVAMLRSEAGRNPNDPDLTNLVGQLSTQSDDFRTLWAAHDVRFHYTAVKQLHHPAIGDLDLNFNRLELPADPGLMLATYTAEPGTRTAQSLQLLASWAATSNREQPTVGKPSTR